MNLTERSVFAYRLGDVEPGLRVEASSSERSARKDKDSSASARGSHHNKNKANLGRDKTYLEVNSIQAATPGANLRRLSLMFCCRAISALI